MSLAGEWVNIDEANRYQRTQRSRNSSEKYMCGKIRINQARVSITGCTVLPRMKWIPIDRRRKIDNYEQCRVLDEQPWNRKLRVVVLYNVFGYHRPQISVYSSDILYLILVNLASTRLDK